MNGPTIGNTNSTVPIFGEASASQLQHISDVRCPRNDPDAQTEIGCTKDVPTFV